MTAKALLNDLYEKYGDDFNWYMPSFIDKTYMQEAKKEIKVRHFLYGKTLYSVFKCKDNNDVIFVTGNKGKDLYVLVHLIYEENKDANYPKYKLLNDIYEVKEYLIKQYVNKINY